MASGSKRERSPGVWELRAHIGRDPLTGKRRDVSRTFRGGARAADRALRDLLAEADELRRRPATPSGPGDLTVAGLLDRWQALRSTEWAPKTAADHRNTIRTWINPRLGDVRLDQLRTVTLDEFYGHLARSGGKDGRPLSPRSVRKVHSVLHAALEDAIRWELLDHNPATRTRRPKLAKHQAVVPSPAQIGGVIAGASPQMASLVRVAVATGARRGELVALRWSDVDLEAGTVHIHRAITRLDGRTIVKTTKTDQSAVLAIGPGTVAALDTWRRHCRDARLAGGLPRLRPSDWVWPDPDDLAQPLAPDAVSHRWRTLADGHGLDGVRFHDLRHAAATHPIAHGVDARTVAGRLRHSSPAMTLDVYAGRDLDADRAAANLIDQLLDGTA